MEQEVKHKLNTMQAIGPQETSSGPHYTSTRCEKTMPLALDSERRREKETRRCQLEIATNMEKWLVDSRPTVTCKGNCAKRRVQSTIGGKTCQLESGCHLCVCKVVKWW